MNSASHNQEPLATGFYELSAVLTHAGRDADGGHYIAWVRDDNNSKYVFH